MTVGRPSLQTPSDPDASAEARERAEDEALLAEIRQVAETDAPGAEAAIQALEAEDADQPEAAPDATPDEATPDAATEEATASPSAEAEDPVDPPPTSKRKPASKDAAAPKPARKSAASGRSRQAAGARKKPRSAPRERVPAKAAGPRQAARTEAGALLAAGLATHLLVLGEGDETPALLPALALVDGPLFRLGPGRFALRPVDADALATATGGEVAPIPADAAPGDDPGLAVLAPLADAALRTAGPRLVVDVEFALHLADRAARGLAEAIARHALPPPSLDLAPVSEALSRLGAMASRLEAGLTPAEGDPVGPEGEAIQVMVRGLRADLKQDREIARSRADAVAERLRTLAETLSSLAERSGDVPPPDALQPLVEDALARLATIETALRTPPEPPSPDPAERLADRIETGLAEHGQALAALREDVSTLPRPNLVAEQEGLRRLTQAMANQIRALEGRLSGLETGLGTRIDAGVDRTIAALPSPPEPPQDLASLRTAIEALREDISTLPRPNLVAEREGLRRLVQAMENQIRALDGKLTRIQTGVEEGLSERLAALVPDTPPPSPEIAALREDLAALGAAVAELAAQRDDRIDRLLEAMTARPAPDLTQERDGLRRTTLALQTMLGALDARLHAPPDPDWTAAIAAKVTEAIDRRLPSREDGPDPRLASLVEDAARSAVRDSLSAAQDAGRALAQPPDETEMRRAIAQIAARLDALEEDAQASRRTLGAAMAELLARAGYSGPAAPAPAPGTPA